LRGIYRGDVSMPTEETVWSWARAHPEFRLTKHKAQGARPITDPRQLSS